MMTNAVSTRRVAWRLVVFVAVVLAVGVAVATAPAAAQSTVDNNQSASAADLIVEQPNYVDTDVQRQSQDGIPVYIVEGETIHVAPENFEMDAVESFGLVTGAGSLSADDEWGRYTLDTGGETGSFRLYWETTETVTVAQGNKTTTEERVERFEAIVRVDDQADVTVLSSAQAQQTQQDAQRWQEFNATVTDIRNSDMVGHIFSEPQSNEDVIQGMINAYLTSRSPFHLLSGGFTAGVIIMSTTVGGLFLLGLLKIPDLLIVRRVWAEVRRYRGLEEEEGDISERQEQLDFERRMANLSNWELNDIPSVTDHEAAELRKAGLGENPLEMLLTLVYGFAPERLKETELLAMGDDGYAFQVDSDDKVAADGGSPVRVVDLDAELRPGETLAERDDLREIDPTATDWDELVAGVSPDDARLCEFDVREADVDPAAIDREMPSLDLRSLVEEFDFSEWAFEDDERVGEILVEFMELIRDHPVTDDDGQVDEVRLQLEQLLQVMQFARDTEQFPHADKLAQHFQAATRAYDQDDDLHEFLQNHRDNHDA
ncbi:hypothetical protein SAMN05216226_102172 [Halovenus aranensis]|uniref:Uncharacterized protein n=1 Tax=Halovenus aranensis TaxID=890420 RepID=A0A1G8SXT4_9EURY|nr:hypothetical protein [Halovenus aranensis]SDJ33360.1 hypothetical protein SAMN05216226_102172 [Halovenus aranensis]